MNFSFINILYFFYYKKMYFLYDDYRNKKINNVYNPVNKYIINKIMNK
jgi:hypothetical protein